MILKLFLVGWGLNLVWEFSHCWLYETCRRQRWRENVPLLAGMALKDGFFIVLFYLVAMWPLANLDILVSPVRLGVFILLAGLFSFWDERISLQRGRWEYADVMPTAWGVGLTPLVEIAVTGVLSFIIVFNI